MEAALAKHQPMTATEILESAWRLYKENAALFLSILAMLLIPQAILDILVPPISFLGTFTTAYATGSLILAIGARYGGQPITATGAYSALGWGTFASLWIVNLLYGIAVVIGLILVIIPGIYLLVRFAFVAPVVVLERSAIGAAFSRSSYLVSGSWWRVFGIGLLIFILFALSAGVLGAILHSVLPQGAANLVGAVVAILVDPFAIGALVLLYFDLRIRKGDVLASDTVTAGL